jgi:hypothetical protein
MQKLNNQKGFAVVEIVLTVLLLAAIGIAGYFVYKNHNTKASTASSTTTSGSNTTSPVAVEIQDSGSTNEVGWDLIINSDGGGKITDAPAQANKSLTPPRNQAFRAKTFDVSSLEQSIDTTNLSSYIAVCRGASASFGTSETLIYNGKSYGGIGCYYIKYYPNKTPLDTQLNNVFKLAGI